MEELVFALRRFFVEVRLDLGPFGHRKPDPHVLHPEEAQAPLAQRSLEARGEGPRRLDPDLASSHQDGPTRAVIGAVGHQIAVETDDRHVSEIQVEVLHFLTRV